MDNKYIFHPVPTSNSLRFVHIVLVPSPSETWFRGMSVGGSFRRWRAGFTLERCSQLAVLAIQPVG